MGILHLSLTVCTYGNPLLNAIVWLIFRYFGEQACSCTLQGLLMIFFFFFPQIQSWMFAVASLSIHLMDLPGSA